MIFLCESKMRKKREEIFLNKHTIYIDSHRIDKWTYTERPNYFAFNERKEYRYKVNIL